MTTPRAPGRRSIPRMATDDRDPGADTGMFRAYVEHPEGTAAPPASQRTLWIAAGLAVVVVAVLLALLVA